MQVKFNKKSKFNDNIVTYFDKAVKILKITENLSCDVCFVSKRKIKQTNKNFRNVNKVTDVLSFPTILKPQVSNMQSVDWQYAKQTSFDNESNTIFIGDILISLSKAKKQAKEYGHSLHREVCYLCVHGLLHLLGYDHMVKQDKDVMRLLEEEILKN